MTYLNNMTRVICRVRPPSALEDNHIRCEPHVGGYLEVSKPAKEESKFGVVLGPLCTQHEVYLSCGVPMIESALRGRDSLLFAYGQTGAGKTFSMYGAEGGKNPSKLDGVVPATVSELFRRTMALEKDSNGNIKFSLGATLVEIQGKNIFDLLAPSDKEGNQPMVGILGCNLIGNKVERIYSSRALTHTIERGMATRATAPNVMHEHSSRSHCFLQLILERRLWRRRPAKGERQARELDDACAKSISNFYMIDLAGSEAFSYDTETPLRGINAGLVALGRVLMAMSDKAAHVPYRDSVVTQLLSGVLGGEKPCLTEMLCCISPGSHHWCHSKLDLEPCSPPERMTHSTAAQSTRAPSTLARGSTHMHNHMHSMLPKRSDTEPFCSCATSVVGRHETKCTLEYARRTARLEADNEDDDDDDALEMVKDEHKEIAAASPMAHDVFDEDEEMNRRAETIQIPSGSVFARTYAAPLTSALPLARLALPICPSSMCAYRVQMW